MNSLLEYYRLNTSDELDDSCYKFTRVKEEDIKICGYSINEIITILNGLEIERITGIKMTMENLSYLYKELLKEQYKSQQEMLKGMFK